MPIAIRFRFLPLLLTVLAVCTGIAFAQTDADSPPIDVEEAERLQSLLREYYAEEQRHDSMIAAGRAQQEVVVTLAGEDYQAAQVLLSGTQGIKALEHIDQRLADRSIPSPRRESDIVFQAEVRQEGSLVSSRSYSLKLLGKSQYLARISLPGGEAEIVVREDAWNLLLPEAGPADYLITLSALRNQAPELHVIPVQELSKTNWTDFPSWLPAIGASPGTAPGS
jgi:hypothetical protein